MRKTESQKIALCGVLSALSVVVLLVGNVLQIGTYAAPMLASFLLIPVLEDYGKKYALLLYAVVSRLFRGRRLQKKTPRKCFRGVLTT